MSTEVCTFQSAFVADVISPTAGLLVKRQDADPADGDALWDFWCPNCATSIPMTNAVVQITPQQEPTIEPEMICPNVSCRRRFYVYIGRVVWERL